MSLSFHLHPRQLSAAILLAGLFLILINPQIGLSQTNKKKELKEKRQKLLDDIELSRKMFKKTRENRKESLEELENLQKQVQIRQRLINNISQEIALINKNMEETNQIISSFEGDLDNLKQEYAKMVRYAYKNLSAQNKLAFIFSAESFNRAYNRLQYFRQYKEFREEQARLIKEVKQKLENKVEDLEKKKQEKEALLAKQSQQREKLRKTKEQKDELVTKLKDKEENLRAEIKEKKQTAEELDQAIKKIIRKEIREAKKQSQEKEETDALDQTPGAAELSADFSNNQNKLPWPVDKGLIASTFGEHYHPVLKGIKTKNNGINIKTSENSRVYSVFEGTVLNVVYNPGFQRAVIVRHGQYFTVYSNLKEIYVQEGDKLTTGDTVGIVYTDPNDGKTELHFEVWKGTEKLNPELWLVNK
jgi:septal ring factor EnvC (AmiA/AmiB activator)